MSTGTTGTVLDNVFTLYSTTDYSYPLKDNDSNYFNDQSVHGVLAVTNNTGGYNNINLYNSAGNIATTTNRYSLASSGITGATRELSYSWNITQATSSDNKYTNNITIEIPLFYYNYNTFKNITFNSLQYSSGENPLIYDMNNQVSDFNLGFNFNEYNTSSMSPNSTPYNTGITGHQYIDNSYDNIVLQMNSGSYSSANINPFTNSSGTYYTDYADAGCDGQNAGWFNIDIVPLSTGGITGPTGTMITYGFFNSDFYGTFGQTGYTACSGSTSSTSTTISNIYLYDNEGTPIQVGGSTYNCNFNATISSSLTSNTNSTVTSYSNTVTITVAKLYDSSIDVTYNNVEFSTTFTSSTNSLLNYTNLFSGLCLAVQTATYTTNSTSYSYSLIMGSGYSNGLYGTIPSSYDVNNYEYNPFSYQGGETSGVFLNSFLQNSCSSINAGWLYIYSLP